MRNLTWAAAAVAAWAVLLLPSPAAACSCFGGVRLISPAHGATDVPLNAEVKLLGTAFDDTVQLELDGQVVAITRVAQQSGDTRYVRLRPVEPLRPNSRYVLSGVLNTDEHAFTTGATTDGQAPSFPGVRDVRDESRSGTSLFGGVDSCGSATGYVLDVAPGTDDRSPPADVWFHVYAGPTRENVDLSAPVTAIQSGDQWLGESLCNHNLDLSTDGVVVLAPVDVAGNEGARADAVALGGCGCGAGGGAPVVLLSLLVAVNRLRRRLPRD